MQNKKAVLRWFFVFLSIFIISLILWNTYVFFNELKDNERSKMQIWAAAQNEFAQTDLESDEDISNIVLQVLQSNITTPMVVYSHKEDSYDVRNIEENETDPEKLRENRKQLAEQFTSEYKPIPIRFNDEILQTIYYGNSPIINKLKYYPIALILIIVLFFTALYFFFQTSKSSEQNKLWAGMAKETAHQIGTPLSSLVGWAEILKEEKVNASYIEEIEKDIDRLKTITERFSKIGSVPALTKTDIVAETRQSFDYLKSRTSKLIEFDLHLPVHPVFVELNPQLYGWTIENLVKNAIDAMKGKGKISISIEATSRHARLLISDTGKGIQKRNFRKVFTPGYTTKTRGWGLGLSLVRRIIEEYHLGKIRVLKSTIGEGTTMEILLKIIR
ncbi:MAG: HAMP domain-containing histidine kinase [Bacteroidia bacterium]|nr:HAMP domain-containing histidine kinase [Bacteroidia bacterium]NNF30429.1 HAMP domain-containing histidine kinase [Flavobacteriaceae bacterium]MBT8275670.1 HAMP domain-containing histidine kinase [Bacteroidia bacterium]NNJ82656.1 HAMP domain-containing histidine kinase [Flavobacteriaceae bacterium]NNK54313.1 HAMP domain-containing histidine kinase [Flavobacteriaceae bacterium]